MTIPSRETKPLITGMRLAALLLPILLVGCVPEPLEPDPIGPTNGWTLVHPRPGGFDLRDVWGQSPDDVWAVGHNGTIVHWTGASYRTVDSPTGRDLVAIDGRSPRDVFACGGDVLLHYDGLAWTVDTRFEGALDDVLCGADGRLYVIGEGGLRIRTGGSWRTLDGPSAMSSVIWTGPDGLIRVGDAGTLWVVDGDDVSVEETYPDSDIVLGDRGLLGRTTGGDVTLVFRFVPDSGWVEQVDAHTSLRAILDHRGVVRATNGGIQLDGAPIWDNDSGHWVYALARCGDGILAGGYGGSLVYGEPFGDEYSWTESAEDVGYRHLNDLDGGGCDDLWGAEWWGRVIHFDGNTWTMEYTGLSAGHAVYDIEVLGEGWVAALGGDRISLHDPNGDWARVPPSGMDINVFQAVTPDSILTADFSHYALWDGSAWTQLNETDGMVMDMAAAPGGPVYALVTGTPNRIDVWTGTEFSPVVELPDLVTRRMCVDPATGVVWAGGDERNGNRRAVIYKYDGSELVDMTVGFHAVSFFSDIVLMSTDDLFMLLSNQLWRLRDGVWTHETGLPTDEVFHAVWGHPDCGVYVEGYPTYFKAY